LPHAPEIIEAKFRADNGHDEDDQQRHSEFDWRCHGIFKHAGAHASGWQEVVCINGAAEIAVVGKLLRVMLQASGGITDQINVYMSAI
jgi:hypothetical protein